MIGYRKQLFWYAVIVEMLAVITFVCSCFGIVWAVSVDNMTASYEKRLQILDEQAIEGLRIIDEYVSIAAEQNSLASACRELRYSTAKNDQNKALREIRLFLMQMFYRQEQVDSAFLITQDAVITKKDYFLHTWRVQPLQTSDTEMTRLAADVLAMMGQTRPLQTRNVLYAAVDAETVLVAVVRDEQIFTQDDTWCLSIEDLEGNRIYESGERPKHFRTVEYVNLQNGMHYVYMLDTAQLVARILFELRLPICLVVALSLLSLIVIHRLTRWAMRPYAILGQTLRDYDTMKRKFPVLVQRLRATAGIRTRVILLYSLGLLPMVCTLNLFAGCMENCVVGIMSNAYGDTVTQNALKLSEKVRSARQLVGMITSDEALHDMLEKEGSADSYQLGELLIRYHAFQIGVNQAGVYEADGTAAYRTSTKIAAQLTRNQLHDFEPNYEFCHFYPDLFSDVETAAIAAVRNTETSRPQTLFSVLGYVYLSFDGLLADATGEMEMGCYYLYDRDRWQLVATPEHLEVRKLVEGVCQARLIELERGESRQLLLPETKEMRMMFSAPVEDTRYVLICLLSPEPLQEFAARMPGYIAVFFCAFVLLILFLAALFGWRITQFSRIVEDYCASASADWHNLPLALMQENEISALGWAFFESMERISQLNESLLQEQKKQALLENRRRQAEVIALQSQMDSHLIGNIFAAMKLLLAQGPGEYGVLKRLVEATGQFLRSGLVHNEYDVTLEREIEHVCAYADIQSIRFGNKLQITFQPVEEELKKAWVPKYLLQPLIENAIIHGMQPRSTLHVHISIAQKDDAMHVCVEDDGAGMSGEALERLRMRLNEGAVSEHIGLINVAERIRLRYGAQYTLTAESQPGGPTRITILFPLTWRTEEGHV